MPLRLRFLLIALIFARPAVAADFVRTFSIVPGTPAESEILVNSAASAIAQDTRQTEKGGFWAYRITAPPSARIALAATVTGQPWVSVLGAEGKPLPAVVDKSATGYTIHATTPLNHPVGTGIRFLFRAKAAPSTIRDIRLTITLPDTNGDGIPDAIAGLMGVTKVRAEPRPPIPHPSFQTGGPYKPTIGGPADTVLAYGSDPAAIKSWIEQGYNVRTMGGFRDGPAYVKEHAGEAQRDVNGATISIGDSYYLVPTQNRIDIAKSYYRAALAAGSSGVCPEEPEYWSRGGYEDAFKQEWQARYGSPWQAPHSSITARYKAEQLKGFLEKRLIESILDDARAAKPAASRMVAVHSPVTYYEWGLPVPHVDLLRTPSLQEIIGQVWTGTARTPARSGGVRMERTFEVGFLEYSSLYNLARSSGKRMWFLMDPVEDNPDRSLDDYKRNYEQTLLASLMFPGVDSYEVMPWPGRIYERVPATYQTEVNTIVGALAEMWRYDVNSLEAGSPGIGTFVSDSMGWQREYPGMSDYDGFYGLCLPLALRGVPVDVLALDRATDAGYLDREKALLVSYDFLKPAGPEVNRALADWVRNGGSLIFFGGSDAFNAVEDSWWRKAGWTSPVEDLLNQLGLPAKGSSMIASSEAGEPFVTLLAGDPNERGQRNRRRYDIDLTSLVRSNGSVEVRFEDVSPGDGWGALVAAAELKIGGRLAAAFKAGSELESRFLAEERNTRFNGTYRYADGTGHWTYRFDGLPANRTVTLTVDMGNGFLVRGRPARNPGVLLKAADPSIDAVLARLRIPREYPVTIAPQPPGSTILYRTDAENAPAVWMAPVGKGTVVYAGVAPGYLTMNATSSRWIRLLARLGMERAGATYRESSSFKVTRGPYTGVRTLGREERLDGRFVNLLDAELAIVEDPLIGRHSWGFYVDAGESKGNPRLLAAAGRIRARSEEPMQTAFLVQAPDGRGGAARIWRGKRDVAGAKVFDLFGRMIPVSVEESGESVLVRYENRADGVVVRVVWK